MRLITLNLWGGIVYEPLMKFIESHSSDTDIFCFQEMLFGDKSEFTPQDKGRINLFSEINSRLTDFVPYKNISTSDHFQHEPIDFPAGQAIFVRKGITVKDNGGFFCMDKIPWNTMDCGKLTGNFQWIECELNGDNIFIGNLHGVWQKDTKKVDTPERFEQSNKVKNFMDTKKCKKILCGDFNLLNDGQSISILENGMKNLIKEYGIISTRSNFYKHPLRFADYVLVSKDININSFKALQDQVSDHLPLLLNFN
ncbi:endonuclease/exonuclease/phosphatase family protein [Candidatus Nomurabacteria bacterium]|nr:endonuclease/exonuclease/phosphatase family protein [Candidatus Nomurabacteria bacterium]